MDAVVLVGGEGTRLRPLTLERPKPVLPLLGRPLLAYVLERLAEAGVTRVIFGCGYLPDPIQACFGDRALGLALEYVVEPRPMGTAGGIRHAARGRVSETFLALNGDILADAPLADLVAATARARRSPRSRSRRSRIPAATGSCAPTPSGGVLGFLEKPEPAQIDTNLINAGAYVLEAGVLDLIEDGRPVSIERETFPSLVGAGLFALAQGGYWSDVGTPESYIAAHHDLLGGRIHSDLPGLMPGACWIDERATVSPDAVLEAPVPRRGGSRRRRGRACRRRQLGRGRCADRRARAAARRRGAGAGAGGGGSRRGRRGDRAARADRRRCPRRTGAVVGAGV